jgi:hypothetical protein
VLSVAALGLDPNIFGRAHALVLLVEPA